MKVFAKILLSCCFLFVYLPAFAEDLPLKIMTLEGKAEKASSHKHFKKEILTLKFPTSSGVLKLKRIGQKVYWDSNQDGTINSRDNGVENKETLAIPVKIGTKNTIYPIYIKWFNKNCVSLGSQLYLTTKLNGQDVEIIDADLDGCFTPGKKDKIKFGNSQMLPFGEAIVINGKIFYVAKPDDVDFLRIAEFTGDTAEIKLATEKNWQVSLDLVHEDTGLTIVASSKKSVMTLPGEYKITSSEAVLYGKDDDDDLFAAFDAPPPILAKLQDSHQHNKLLHSLEAGENIIAAGPPFSLNFYSRPDKKKPDSFRVYNIKCMGVAGESYRPYTEGDDRKSSLKNYIRSGDQEEMLSKLQYGRSSCSVQIPATFKDLPNLELVFKLTIPGYKEIKFTRKLQK